MAYKKLPYKDAVREGLDGNISDPKSKPPRGTLIRKDVTILKSKKDKARHEAIAAECGLDKNLRPIKKVETSIDPLQDPVYYRDQLGDTSKLSWEEL